MVRCRKMRGTGKVELETCGVKKRCARKKAEMEKDGLENKGIIIMITYL